ncbi:hypothetical protein GmHk_U059389 [Glycine max]|nr:hypothetical protein GmHk_U059389 [Glycine max]
MTLKKRFLGGNPITSIAQSNTSRLGFPALITALCRARGVVSDSLTFERLIPVINLAYIRKNCWKPEDLTVSIRGAWRARARPVELPSTFAAPTRARTLAAPSAPALFNEWVAWPRTQSSLHREDEGPIAQVPQQMEDKSSETTLAANPSTPEDYTTPVLSLNTSPTTTLVLHLIDEEDVQTQDTHDRSQDF